MGKIVHRYIFRETLAPFALGLSLFTFILLLARLLRLIELVVNRGLPFTSVLRLFAYIMPAFLEVTVPMAMLLAILVAFGRLSADSEMVAFRSAGLSLYQLAPPIAAFAVLTMIATAGLSLYATPWGNRSLKSALYDIARTRASAGLKPEVFNDEFPGLVIYAERIEGTADRLHHVLISDDRDPHQHSSIFAREGFMVSDRRAQTVTLRLLDGAIHSSDGDGRTEYRTDFQSYDVNLDLREAFAGLRQREPDPKELTLPQLRKAIATKRAQHKPYSGELVEFHRKFAIPLACLVFGLVAIPLGAQPSRGAKSRGFAVSLALIFVYYMLLSAGQALAQQGLVPVPIGLWLPNVVFGSLGVLLFVRAAQERHVLPLERWEAALLSLRTRIGGAFGLAAGS